MKIYQGDRVGEINDKIRCFTKKISAIFLKYRNDVTVFTEDNVKDREFYKTLLKRLVENDRININDVIQLGCRNIVIKSCVEESNKRNKIYIVDGDLDLIADKNSKDIDNLFILNVYCIENFLIDKSATIQLLYYNNCGDKRKIERELNFNKWLGYNAECLITLFRHLALAQEIGIGPLLMNAHNFLEKYKKETILSISKVKERIKELKTEILVHFNNTGVLDSENEYRRKMMEYKSRWPTNNENLIAIVSGKDYLIPLLQFRIQKIIPKSKSLFPIHSIKIFLADHCDLERLSSLRKFIIDNAH